MIVAAVVSIIALSHHPSVHGHGAANLLAQMARLRASDEVVHAIAIAAAGTQLAGLVVFSLRRGLRKATVVAALVAYAIGTGTIVAAAVIDGFLIPGIAVRTDFASAGAAETALALVRFAVIAVQACTKVALVAMAVAIVLWSVDIVRGTVAVRATATVGFVAGAAMLAIALFGGWISAHVVGAVGALATIWNVAIGALMIRRDV